jgi:hypothetical protein
MFFSRVTVYLIALLAMIAPATVQANDYSKWDIYTLPIGIYNNFIDNSKAHRILANVPGIKVKDIWFAQGIEHFRKSPGCITSRAIWVYSKPVLSTPGLYRGIVSLIIESPKNQKHAVCNQMNTQIAVSIPTASFQDPNNPHTIETLNDEYIGVFRVDATIPDSTILDIDAAIPSISKCITSKSSCPYNIDKTLSGPTYRITPVLKSERLEELNLVDDTNDGTLHYKMLFAGVSALVDSITLDIYYKDNKITRIKGDIWGGDWWNGPPFQPAHH